MKGFLVHVRSVWMMLPVRVGKPGGLVEGVEKLRGVGEKDEFCGWGFGSVGRAS